MTERFGGLGRGLLAGLVTLVGLVSSAGCTWESDCCGIGPEWATSGSGVLATRSWDLGGFSGIAASGAVSVEIRQADFESVSVTAEDNILPLLAAEVHGDRLALGPRSGTSFSATEPIVFRVTCISLGAIGLSGASQARAEAIDTDSLEVGLSGSSVAVVSGRADRLLVGISGGSRFDGSDLAGRIATVGASGASHAVVRVSEFLEARASGASAVQGEGSER